MLLAAVLRRMLHPQHHAAWSSCNLRRGSRHGDVGFKPLLSQQLALLPLCRAHGFLAGNLRDDVNSATTSSDFNPAGEVPPSRYTLPDCPIIFVNGRQHPAGSREIACWSARRHQRCRFCRANRTVTGCQYLLRRQNLCKPDTSLSAACSARCYPPTHSHIYQVSPDVPSALSLE